MALAPGTRLGPYEILGPLGAGGMGEVWQARDPRLGRDVAIKVLPGAFNSDPDRLHRFEQEARAAAALNHPNILAVYDIGTCDGQPYVVSELLDRQTLRDALADGPLPVRKIIDYGVQIANGLAAAHEKGIIHRDLKPENLFVTQDSRVKILDFGLAKLTEAQPVFAGISASPTTPPAGTQPGWVLGTMGYMSPEQVRGSPVDHRTDLFAFGAVIYEMLSGQRAFRGDTPADTMTSILKETPSDLSAARRPIPPGLVRIVDRCLEKTPAARFQTASDLGFALEGLSATIDSSSALPSLALRSSRKRFAWTLATVALLIAGIGVVIGPRWRTTLPSPVARLMMLLPDGEELATPENPGIAIAPTAGEIAYVATRRNTPQLYLRAINSFDTKPLSGTEGAANPFFSPDGQWIGFFSQGKLKKISLRSGTTETLCDAPIGRGGSWGPDGRIYFAARATSGISSVADTGGIPAPVTSLDRSKGEVSHRWPQVLPGGRALMFTVWTGPGREERHVYVQLLDTGERRLVARGADSGRYIASGHVVYARARADEFFAVPFDIARLQVTGQAMRLGDAVRAGAEGAHYTVSDTGVLAFFPGNPQRRECQLVWVGRDGQVEPLPAPPQEYANPISPDGQRAAVTLDAGASGQGIWIYDFSRATLTPLRVGTGSSQAPRWSPDGKRIVYRGTRMGFRNLWWTAVDETENEERLTTGENMQVPASWSSDGQWLIYVGEDPTTGQDVWGLHPWGDRTPRVIIRTRFNERSPRLSSDGRWLAYTSDESGREEVFVQPFPGPGVRKQISINGGGQPVWSHDGRELFYRNGDAMMVVATRTTPTIVAGTPRVLFRARCIPSPIASVAGYDVSPDGQRFLCIQTLHPESPTNQINVVMDWFEELRRVMSTK